MSFLNLVFGVLNHDIPKWIVQHVLVLAGNTICFLSDLPD